MSGVIRTSVYLHEQEKRDLERIVEITGRSQSELIRDGIDQVIQHHLATRPKMRARFHDAVVVGRSEELMDGFGG